MANFDWTGNAGDDNGVFSLADADNWATQPGNTAGLPGSSDDATINATDITLSGALNVTQLTVAGAPTFDQATLTLGNNLVLEGDLILNESDLVTNNASYDLLVDTSIEIEQGNASLAGKIVVGNTSDDAELQDELGSSVSATGAIVGNQAGSDGTVIVSDSTFRTDTITIGQAQTSVGELTLTDRAVLQGLNDAAVSLIDIGFGGSGSLQTTAANDQSTTNTIAASEILIAVQDDSAGALSVAEVSLVVGYLIDVGVDGDGGADGTGGLTETSGEIVAAGVGVAVAAESTGNLAIDSTLIVATPNADGDPIPGTYGNLSIGIAGQAWAEFGSGAQVTADDIDIASQSGSVASVTIDLATVNAQGDFVVGDSGTAVVNVDSSSLTSATAEIARRSGSSGQVVLSAATWTISGTLTVGGGSGAGGAGTLTVEDASLLSTGAAIINSDSVNVSSSSWYADSLTIGNTAPGILEFAAGDLAGLTNAAVQSITLGDNYQGKLEVNSGGNVDANAINVDASGTLAVASGGLVYAQTVNIVPGGEIDLSAGGSLDIGTGNGGQTTGTSVQTVAAAVDITGSGVLAGAGIIDGTLNDNSAASGAVVATGGALEITGAVSGGGVGPLVVAAGAAMELGGADAAAVDLSAGNAELSLGQAKNFTGQIVGFSQSDVIDLAGVAYSSISPAPVLEADNVLWIGEDGGTYDLNFDPTQKFTGFHFVLGSDGKGGTEVTLVSGVPPPAVPPLLGLLGTGAFNHGADADVVFQGGDGTLTLWLMNGTSATAATEANPGTSWQFLATGDFNGDGNSDLVFQNVNGTPAVWLMNGGSEVNAAVLPNPTASWHVEGTADVTDAGHNESILFQNNDGQPAIWVLNGTNVVDSYALSDPGQSWQMDGAGDFFRSGFNNSLLWQNVNGTPAIWEMNGGTIVNAFTLPNPTASFRVIGVGDFTGDGHNDSILFQHSDGMPAVWVMNGSTLVNAFALPNPGPSWQITGIGDFNGDGNSDIFFENSGTGQDAVWLMNGTTVSSTAIVTPSNSGQFSDSSAAYTAYAASPAGSAQPAATQSDLSSSLIAADRTPVLGINSHT